MILGTIVGTIVIVAVTIAIGIVVDRRLGLTRRPAPLEVELQVSRPRRAAHAAGEAPATAIHARASQLATLRASQRCPACRALLTDTGADDRVRFGDRELVVLHFRCPRCDAKRVLYVDPVK